MTMANERGISLLNLNSSERVDQDINIRLIGDIVRQVVVEEYTPSQNTRATLRVVVSRPIACHIHEMALEGTSGDQ